MPKALIVPPQAIFAAFFLLLFFTKFQKLTDCCLNPWGLCIFFLLSWLCISDLINVIAVGGWQEFRYFAGRAIFIVLVFATYAFIRNENTYRSVLQLVTLSVVVLASITILCGLLHINPFGADTSRHPRIFWGIMMPTERAIGVPMSYGEYGLIMNSVLPLFFVSFFKKGFLYSRSLSLSGIILILGALMITQSRNSWLATSTVLLFLVFFLTIGIHEPSLKAFGVFTIVSVALLMAALLQDQLQFLFNGFALGRQSQTFFNRLAVDRLAYSVFLSNWLFGVGHKELDHRIITELGLNTVVHNGYIDQLASNGIFGFMPYFLLMILAILLLTRTFLKGPTSYRMYALCLAGSFVGNMAVLSAYKGTFSETAAIQYGLLLSLMDITNKKKLTDDDDYKRY